MKNQKYKTGTYYKKNCPKCGSHTSAFMKVIKNGNYFVCSECNEGFISE